MIDLKTIVRKNIIVYKLSNDARKGYKMYRKAMNKLFRIDHLRYCSLKIELEEIK